MTRFIAGITFTLAAVAIIAKAFGMILVGVSWGWVIAAILAAIVLCAFFVALSGAMGLTGGLF